MDVTSEAVASLSPHPCPDGEELGVGLPVVSGHQPVMASSVCGL